MLLQPIVENAIQHGIGRRAQGGTIWVIVRAIEEGKRLLVLVRDHAGARGHDQDLVAGVGMPAGRAALAEIDHAAVVVV